MLVKITLFYSTFFKFGIYCQRENINFWYNAAVVEYHAADIFGTTIEEQLIARAKSHIDLLKNINQELEIILYPEKSLIPDGPVSQTSTKVPEKFDQIICNSTDEQYASYLKLFSCAAIEYNTSIAVNVIEKDVCECKTKNIYYNTVVVFDEQGFVSGRYRKWNLFGEFQLSKPTEYDVTVIKTKNNVSFGIMTCFDINFNIPSMNLTAELDIKNILFPNNWISELPYLTALQVQQMWAQEHNVVLLSAGLNNPKKGASGSGIFLGEKGPLERVFIGGNGGTKVVIQKIPTLNSWYNFNMDNISKEEDTDELAKELDDFFLLRDLSMDGHTSILMNENETRIIEEVCNGDSFKLCCNFEITFEKNESIVGKSRYRYQLVAFNGMRSFSGLRNAAIEACAVVACLNDSLSSCGLRFSNYSDIVWPIFFQEITVQGTFINEQNRAQYPNSLLSSLRPILPKFTSWEKEEMGETVVRKHVLKKPENRLLTFGIFGRDFGRDDSLKPSDNGAANIPLQDFTMYLILIIVTAVNCLVLF